MIPEGQYDRTRLDRLARHLVVQLRNAQSSRSQLEEKWKMYERAYRTKPMFEKKDFPFEGCSNLVVPLIATDVDKVYAWIMAMLFGQDNLWSVSAWRPDWMDFASKAQEFLEWSQSNELNIYPEIADWVKELCLLGTSVLKTRYDRQVEKVYEYREQQTTNGQQGQVFERQARVMMKDQPKVEHLSVWDFYLDPAATKVEDEVGAENVIGEIRRIKGRTIQCCWEVNGNNRRVGRERTVQFAEGTRKRRMEVFSKRGK